jgi:hypothetical protein
MAKKRVKANLTIRVSLTPGICRWCRCTDDTPCANGCHWVERTQTLCSECVPLDKALQTMAGRRELAEFTQEYGYLVGERRRATTTPRRRKGSR